MININKCPLPISWQMHVIKLECQVCVHNPFWTEYVIKISNEPKWIDSNEGLLNDNCSKMINSLLLNARTILTLKNLRKWNPRDGSVSRLFSSKCGNYVGTVKKNHVHGYRQLLGKFDRNVTFVTSRNLNVGKFNKSEVRRLLSLAKPEKWKLLGKICCAIRVVGM